MWKTRRMTGVRIVKICLHFLTCFLLELPVLFLLHLSTATVRSLPICCKNVTLHFILQQNCNLQHVATDCWSLRHSVGVTCS
jgi:hypothetical protein